MPSFLSMIPKPFWFAIGGALIMSSIIFTSYRAGVINERTEQELRREQEVKAQVQEGLEEVQKELEEAMKLQKEKEAVVASQKDKLTSSERRSEELQRLLDDILSKPTTECDTLPDATYRLYTDMYNKRPTDRTN